MQVQISGKLKDLKRVMIVVTAEELDLLVVGDALNAKKRFAVYYCSIC